MTAPMPPPRSPFLLEAIVLAGGRGTRLAAVVPDLPKPLAPVAGRPFLHYLLAELASQGFSRVVLSVGYMAEKIEQAIGPRYGSMEIAYCREESPLGTGGAIRVAMAHATQPQVFVLNGDTWANFDYGAMLLLHRRVSAPLTMGLVTVPDTSRYGAVEVAGGRVTGFLEKGVAGCGYINGGVYVMERGLFEAIEPPALPERFSFEEEVLQAHLASLRPMAYVGSGYFIDIGVPEDYARAQIEIPANVRQMLSNTSGVS